MSNNKPTRSATGSKIPLEFPFTDEQLQEMASNIAKKELLIKTLVERKMDSLDFHEVAVWSVSRALKEAFKQGFEAAMAMK